VPTPGVLRKDITDSKRPIWVIVIAEGILICVLSIAVITLLLQRVGETARVKQVVTDIVSTQCYFYVPLMISGNELPPPPKPASKLAIQLVEGSRQALYGLGCTSDLVPPSPALLKLGRKYGVPIKY
jgi:hypothetical protein